MLLYTFLLSAAAEKAAEPALCCVSGLVSLLVELIRSLIDLCADFCFLFCKLLLCIVAVGVKLRISFVGSGLRLVALHHRVNTCRTKYPCHFEA